VRASPCLHPYHSASWKRLISDQELRVFPRVNVIGHNRQAELLAQPFAKPQDEHRFTGADRPADSNAHKLHGIIRITGKPRLQDRNS
jgi:hypothetical protein